MDETDKLARSVKALAIAVWVLSILTAAQLAFTLWAYLRPQTFTGYETAPLASASAPSVSSGVEDNDFRTLSPEEKITRASMILITKNEIDGATLKAVISEIVKKRANTTFYLSVGDEYRELSHVRRANEEYGDGQVVFLTGNPASFRESHTYSRDRIGSMGQMPLSTLRQSIEQAR